MILFYGLVFYGCFFGSAQGPPERTAFWACGTVLYTTREVGEPQRLERGAGSGSPHVAAALTLARPEVLKVVLRLL